MGKSKTNLEFITKEKLRNSTFKKRKQSLIRKMHEFTTLCDVSACMIIYGPRGAVAPEVWPQNVDKVRQIIDSYKAKNKESSNRTFGLSDFLQERKRKIEDELAKLRKRNIEAKYPTWFEFMNGLTEAQLREFASSLSNKAACLKSRIESLRRDRGGLNMNLMDFAHARFSQSHSYYPPGLGDLIELEVLNQRPVDMHVPLHYPTMDHHQHQELHHSSVSPNSMWHSVNQNSLNMLLTNDCDRYVQFGEPSSSGNIQTSFSQQVFYEPAPRTNLVDPTMYQSPKPLAWYYAPSMPPPVPAMPPYAQYTVVPEMAPPQLHLSTEENHEEEDDLR